MHEVTRLKILFIPSPGWYPSAAKPVAGVSVKEHAKAVALYHDVTILYATFGTNHSIRKPFQVSDQIEDGIRTVRVVCQWKVPVINLLLYYWSIFICFRKLVKEGWKPDIIHAHAFWAGLPAWLLSRVFNVPFIITERWSGFVIGGLSGYERRTARFSMNRAALILPVSNSLGEAIKSYGITSKFQIVPNVVDTKVFRPLSPQNKWKRGESKKLLLVAGLRPIKGIPCLLEALRKLSDKRDDFVLDIVGDGVCRKEYEMLVKQLGLEEKVNFHGYKPKEEVAEFMRNCDFYVQPSLWETFAIPCIEAMACGKPVIASNVAGPNETITPDTGILVPPGDTKALFEAIEYMLDNYQNYPPNKIAQYARERFSYETVGRQLSEVYQAVLPKEKQP